MNNTNSIQVCHSMNAKVCFVGMRKKVL